MKLLMRIAWRNIWRQSRRTWITIGAMSLGIALSMACIACETALCFTNE